MSRRSAPLFVLGALLVVHLGMLTLHPRASSAANAGVSGRDSTRVGIVLDVGGRGDKSFNDGAYAGGERAERTLGAQLRFIEPGDGSDREAGLRLLSAEGMNLVVGVGFIFTDDLLALAREYPQVHYAGIDLAITLDSNGRPVPPPANLAVLRFREEEGAFLVGALAALTGGSQRIGFVGGMDIPLIHKFESGYRAGVHAVCDSCVVVAEYAGSTPEAFRNPARGKELALSEYASGVNVIFQAAGATGLGVFEAARLTGKLVIGADADQWAEAPGHVLTSMVKGVDAATFDVIQRVHNHQFRGGIYSFGLREGGVGYVYDAHNRGLIPDSVHARVEALRRDIVAGKIVVPVPRT
jgi:basic membrane protein A